MAAGGVEDWVARGLALAGQWLQAGLTWLREMQEAQARAEALLRDSLTEGEYQGLHAKGHLEIRSHCRPGRLYHVPVHGGRVRVFEQGRFCGELCVGPVVHLPSPDVVLSHKLMIEGCEEEYLRRARWIQTIMPTYTLLGLDYCELGQQQQSDREESGTPPP